MNTAEKSVKKKVWTIYGVFALILFILLAMALLDTSGPHYNKAALRAKASIQISQIYTACRVYETEYGTLPPSSENYRRRKFLCGENPRGIAFLSLNPSDVSPNGEMNDPWGTPFRITFDPEPKVVVISAGPDKIFGTPDDITNQ